MADETLAEAVTETADQTTTQELKTYSEEEFNSHMAGLKKSLTAKFEKQLADLGDLGELKSLKATAEKQKQEEAIKRGEFEKILQDMAAKKDAEIQEKNRVIEEFTVNQPLLNAAAQYKAVNPQQVVQLIRNQVRLGESGQAEVIDESGTQRYDSKGNPVSVDYLVQEFLSSNPHFVAAAPATSNTKTAVNGGSTLDGFDIAKLDLTKASDRKLYQEARMKGLL